MFVYQTPSGEVMVAEGFHPTADGCVRCDYDGATVPDWYRHGSLELRAVWRLFFNLHKGCVLEQLRQELWESAA